MIHAVKVHDFLNDKDKAPGKKVLVDKLWPRGVAKDDLAHDEWFKEVAPSSDLRSWFGHDPERFQEFSRRYRSELDDCDSAELEQLLTWARNGALSLFYAAKDREINHAVVLKQWLEEAVS